MRVLLKNNVLTFYVEKNSISLKDIIFYIIKDDVMKKWKQSI